MVLGDAVSRLETFIWILNHISRSITCSMSNDQSQHDLWCDGTCQIIDWLKFETRPSSLLNFRTAYSNNFLFSLDAEVTFFLYSEYGPISIAE